MPRITAAKKAKAKADYKAGVEHVIDAKNKRLGRLASEVAQILQGKHRANYEPREVGTDRVVVKNVGLVSIGGKKETDKVYYRHTGYMGHLKEETYAQMFTKSPEKVVREAVRRMLPKNFLNARRLSKLSFGKKD
jgi:large subunit ribosomal protein L13